jgi:hypothetical protein
MSYTEFQIDILQKYEEELNDILKLIDQEVN